MLLSVNHVSKSYRQSLGWRRQPIKIIDDVSLSIDKQECVGLVGESGSGKSTLTRIISGIEKPDSGNVLLNGQSIYQRRCRKQKISIVFQDYMTSVNASMTVFQVISEPLLLEGYQPTSILRHQVAGLLQRVGLSADLMDRYPYQLSGGQVQRVCISRALATHPAIIILDEALSSLDVPTQVQILDLLETLQHEFNLSYLFITHDIQLLCYLCQKVIFFHQHKIIEQCDIEHLASVTSTYAQCLLDAVI